MALAPPFTFTKGCRTMRFDALPWMDPFPFGTLLFDLQSDPMQESPPQEPAVERMMVEHLKRLMRETDAPAEQFERLGLE